MFSEILPPNMIELSHLEWGERNVSGDGKLPRPAIIVNDSNFIGLGDTRFYIDEEACSNRIQIRRHDTICKGNSFRRDPPGRLRGA